jgi:signal transduction histidine kinase
MLCQATVVEESKIEKELRRGAATLQSLPLAVCQFDQKGRIMYQNPEASHVFGSIDDVTIQQQREEVASSSNQNSSTLNHQSSTDQTTSDGPSELRTEASATNTISPSSCDDTLPDASNTRIEPWSVGRIKDGGGVTGDLQSPQPTNTTTVSSDGEHRIPTPVVRNDFLNRFVDQQVAEQLFAQILSGKDVTIEALIQTKHGPGWSAINASLGKDAVTEDPIIYYSARDISEIVNAKKLNQHNKERAEFFAIMAHEIRTPLFQVTGFVELLDQTELNDEQKGYTKLLHNSATSLMTVINDILDYSKLEAGKLKLSVLPFEPKAVLDGALAAVTHGVEEKGLTLRNTFATGLPVKLMGDPNRLRQVLSNLLQNAVKFTHRGGIEVCVSRLEDQEGQVCLRFSVTDTGIGIDSDNLTNIFRQYNQAAPAIATAYGGTGLGLSISKSLVACMGGTIGVESTIGKGSTFWFEIPFDRPKVVVQAPTEPANATKKIGAAVQSYNVLVAEDNGVSQKLIFKMLGRIGHKATIVENGELCVQEVQNGGYDILLMDIQMPVMDGIDATKEIRSLGYTLPIVGLTASVRREDFRDLGLDDWIGKPVRLKELTAKIDALVQPSSPPAIPPEPPTDE